MSSIRSKSTTTSKKQCVPLGRQWKPQPYMLKAVKWLVGRAAAALFLDPGLGKTSITLAAICALKRAKLFKGALVIAPLRPATSTWPGEQQEWSDFHHLDMVVLHGRDKERLASERHDIYVINYEGLPWLIEKGYLKDMLKKGWLCTLIFDELTKMKNASKKAVRRKLLWAYLPRFERRWGLTGSPASNGLMNLFGQINVLDLGAAFGPYITHFRLMFFTPINDWNWALKAGAEDLIYDRIAPVALRMAAEDYITLPEEIHHDIYIELPPAARKAYDEMEAQMLTLLDNELVSAGTASAVYGKCRQIASGAVYRSIVDPITGEPMRGSADWSHVHDEKLDALEELVDELNGQQLLVAYEYGHDIERIKHRFGKDVPHIGSGVSPKRAKWLEDAWNAGDLNYMFGHPASMGHGLNLQKGSAHHVAWFTLTPDYELYDQFNRRIRRRGNAAKHVTLHRIIARRTVEAWAVAPSLKRKHAGQESLFDGLRARAKEYLKTIRK